MPIPEFPVPFWQAAGARLYLGDVRACLRALPTRSVHCVVTSPPYWGLRDYGTAQWEGGSTDCDHIENTAEQAHRASTLGLTTTQRDSGEGTRLSADNAAFRALIRQYRHICKKCGARRIDKQLGMEPIADCLGWVIKRPCGECFVCHMVEVFAELWRVLRDDGTVWLNLGDTYSGSGMTGGTASLESSHKRQNRMFHRPGAGKVTERGASSNQLLGVPWRVALALQASGWVLRQDIIWSKPNAMPESVTNRCTKSHEHIFLLAKSNEYYYDIESIREKEKGGSSGHITQVVNSSRRESRQRTYETVCGANKRDVWIVPTQGYPGAHYAVFSPLLITPCILAGTSEYGCCAECGMPYERVIKKGPSDPAFLPNSEKDRADTSGRSVAANASRANRAPNHKDRDRSFPTQRNGLPGSNSTLDEDIPRRETIGWRKVCGCQTDKIIPCVVLDPFVGSGTTVATALELGRAGVGIDLSEQYLKENAIPRIEAALRGEKVRRVKAVLLPSNDTPPPPKRLRSS